MLYLAVYLAMNLAAFAVICAVEAGDTRGDDVSALAGLGRRSPWLAWAMTVAMLSLAGIPGTVGFIGKFQLIRAMVSGDVHLAGDRAGDRVDDLARVLPAGGGHDVDDTRHLPKPASTLRLCPAVRWRRSPAGRPRRIRRPGTPSGWPRSDESAPAPETVFVAALFAAASVFFGIFPSPLFHLAAHAGHALGGIF